jgi:hypothetical protein
MKKMGIMDALRKAKDKAATVRQDLESRKLIRQAEQLETLRKERIRTEGEARLVSLRQKEEGRIAKARATIAGPKASTGQPSNRPSWGTEQTGLFGAHKESPFTLGGSEPASLPRAGGGKKGRKTPTAKPQGFQGTNPYNLY